MFSSARSLYKIESLQKRALRYLYRDYESQYNIFLAKPGKVTMEASRLRSLCIEICNSLNSINLSFMNKIFSLTVTNRAVRSKVKQVSFGNKNLR